MVMVSHSAGFVFLKTRKTAGTSVEMVLEPLCRPAGETVTEATPTRSSRTGIVGRRLMGRSRLQRWGLQTDWYNHMPAAEVRAALGRARWDRYVKITSIRNPFDLAVSRFHWDMFRRGEAEAADFAETRQAFIAMMRHQTIDCDHAVTHIDGVFVANLVIRFERLAQDLEATLRQVAPGIPIPTLPQTKDMSGRRKRPFADYYDEPTIEAVRKSAAWVFERFDYAHRPEDAAPTLSDANEVHK